MGWSRGRYFLGYSVFADGCPENANAGRIRETKKQYGPTIKNNIQYIWGSWLLEGELGEIDEGRPRTGNHVLDIRLHKQTILIIKIAIQTANLIGFH